MAVDKVVLTPNKLRFFLFGPGGLMIMVLLLCINTIDFQFSRIIEACLIVIGIIVIIKSANEQIHIRDLELVDGELVGPSFPTARRISLKLSEIDKDSFPSPDNISGLALRRYVIRSKDKSQVVVDAILLDSSFYSR